MVNVIWQTRKDNISVLSDETNGQYEYITKVIFKNLDYIEYFDNNQYKTFLDNTIIIYSAPGVDISSGMMTYLRKYNSLKLNYILFHISNECLYHNYYYYQDAKYVFRFYRNKEMSYSNVTVLPLGFVSGYMNNEGMINLSDKRDLLVTFIGQVKADRQILVDSMMNIDRKFLHLTHNWNCPSGLSINKVIEIYKRTVFVPCPMGWTSPDSLRLFEALEWGCIPIIKKYNGVDYYKYIFGEHPIPIVNEWTEIDDLIKKLNNENLDNLILSINQWYKDFMNKMSINVVDIVNKKLNN